LKATTTANVAAAAAAAVAAAGTKALTLLHYCLIQTFGTKQ
jgi:hypothetical protein